MKGIDASDYQTVQVWSIYKSQQTWLPGRAVLTLVGQEPGRECSGVRTTGVVPGTEHRPALLEHAASARIAAALHGKLEPPCGGLPAGAAKATPFVCLPENWLAQVLGCLK